MRHHASPDASRSFRCVLTGDTLDAAIATDSRPRGERSNDPPGFGLLRNRRFGTGNFQSSHRSCLSAAFAKAVTAQTPSPQSKTLTRYTRAIDDTNNFLMH
jgi:hypothetical protein